MLVTRTSSSRNIQSGMEKKQIRTHTKSTWFRGSACSTQNNLGIGSEEEAEKGKHGEGALRREK